MNKWVGLNFSRRSRYGLISGLMLMAGAAGAVEKNIYYQIGEQSLDKALKQYAAQTDVQVVYSTEAVASHAAQAVEGNYSPDQALSLLLNNSGLQYRFSSDDLVVVELKSEEKQSGGDQSRNKYKRDKSRDSELEEMIVTAQKREQSVKDVPISVVALGAAELEKREIGDMVELGMAVPGLFVEDNGDSRTVYLRGIGNVAGVPMVGLYIDEMPITSFLSQGQLDTRLYDLERVEVLRGPQGTIYGEGSMGGTIRFITADPKLDQFGGKANISASYTQDGAPSHKTQGVINIPLIENELAFRIAGTFDSAGGWVDQPAVNQKDVNDQSVKNIRIKGLWRPSDTLDVSAMAVIHRNSAGALNQAEDENGNFQQTFGFTTTPSWDDNYSLYNLTVKKDFDSTSFVAVTSYTESDQSTLQAGRYFYLSPPPAPPFDIMGLTRNEGSEAFFQEFRLSSTSDSNLQWTVGTFYRDFDFYADGSSLFGIYTPGAELPPASSFLADNNSKSWAVFADVSYAVTDRLEIGAGARYFEDDRTTFDGTAQQEASFNSVNPRFYISFDASDDAKIYASVAKGFRSGGFNAQGQPPYDADALWTYELGTKLVLIDGRLDTEFALFYSDYEDLQILGVPPPPAFPQSIISNGGGAEIKGMDFTVNWNATDNLSFHLNGSLADAKVSELNVTDSPYELGDRIDFVPEYSFTASANYDFSVANKPGFARVDYNQRGTTLWTYRLLGPHFIGKSSVNNMLNFKFGVDLSERITFAIFAKNLLNDRDLIAPTYLTGFAARNRPRTVGIEFGFDFE